MSTAPTPTVDSITPERADWILRMLWRIRLFEEQMLEFLNTGVIKGGSHLYIGQEAVATGVCGALTGDDYITSTHRGHGHGLAKGGDSKRLLAEILGRSTGVCRGGSLHLADMETGNLGANGIVGGSLAIACGAALSAQMRKTGQVVACFFGDGAISTGLFHESLNMAQVWKLPVLFVCENNLYAMSVSPSRAPGLDDLAQTAAYFAARNLVIGVLGVLDQEIRRLSAGSSLDSARRGAMHERLETAFSEVFGSQEHEWEPGDTCPVCGKGELLQIVLEERPDAYALQCDECEKALVYQSDLEAIEQRREKPEVEDRDFRFQRDTDDDERWLVVLTRAGAERHRHEAGIPIGSVDGDRGDWTAWSLDFDLLGEAGRKKDAGRMVVRAFLDG